MEFLEVFIEALKNIVNFICDPKILITLSAVALFASLKWPEKFYSDKSAKILFGVMIGFFLVSLFDSDFRKVVTKPDNVPIVGMLFMIPFFTWFSMREAVRNDKRLTEGKQLVEQEETAEKVLTWPDLVYTELICLVAITVILIAWSMVLPAPLEDPANPQASPNPSKAPWYFLGLQEMLVYFDPWIAGVVMPSIIMVGLMVFPYVDSNPLGNGYYTLKQRRFALWMFGAGFLQWILLIVIGTFIRGPGWIWFWPGQTWDHNAVVFDKNIDLHDMIAHSRIGKAIGLGFLASNPFKFIFGMLVVGGFYVVGALFFHWLMTVDFKQISFRPLRLFPKKEFEQKLLARTSLLQYLTFQFFAVSVLLALPVKLILRLALTIKYVWVTPWFNI
jgi:hypothetical protein